MKLNYDNLREKFHDLKSQSTSFNTGIKLLKERIVENDDYEEIISLMDESLIKTNKLWKKLKEDIKWEVKNKSPQARI